ncbi:hypothetical protein L1987_30018 [Smallanthus sonchifolius]|uniref:Uncharacterized protein n=1 Tax=Smallanthus sonchifolius TaxID=185202 RepID=A0ACB9I2Y0_9ASTR|nr:hypothetical protein L1987_30018 [Smallanthus sonchifolius]
MAQFSPSPELPSSPSHGSTLQCAKWKVEEKMANMKKCPRIILLEAFEAEVLCIMRKDGRDDMSRFVGGFLDICI